MIGLFFLAAGIATPLQTGCTATTARRVTVAEIGERPEHFQGQCVRVGGPFASIALYGSVADLYFVSRFALDGNRDPAALRRGRVGLYSEDGKLRGLKPISDGIPHVEIIGTVDSCDAMKDRAVVTAKAEGDPNPFILMGGYCHYHNGTVIRAIGYSFDPPRRYERLLGDSNRKRFGDLVPMPRGWRDRSSIERAMVDWRAMIGRGDRAALSAEHDFGETENEFEKQALDRLLDSSIRRVRNRAARPSLIFLHKLDVDRVAAGRVTEGKSNATLCICRAPSCKGIWPIARQDADNHPSRPYVCTSVVWRKDKAGQRQFQTGSGRDGGLGEPRRTSFTR